MPDRSRVTDCSLLNKIWEALKYSQRSTLNRVSVFDPGEEPIGHLTPSNPPGVSGASCRIDCSSSPINASISFRADWSNKNRKFHSSFSTIEIMTIHWDTYNLRCIS